MSGNTATPREAVGAADRALPAYRLRAPTMTSVWPLALCSRHPGADVSTVVPLLDEPVTSFRPSAVATEHGVAAPFGRDQRAPARSLIKEAAHPRVRDELREEAHARAVSAGSPRPP